MVFKEKIKTLEDARIALDAIQDDFSNETYLRILRLLLFDTNPSHLNGYSTYMEANAYFELTYTALTYVCSKQIMANIIAAAASNWYSGMPDTKRALTWYVLDEFHLERVKELDRVAVQRGFLDSWD